MYNHALVETIKQAIEASRLDVDDIVDFPSRKANLALPPANLVYEVKRVLMEQFPSGIYTHQVEGIQTALDGQDICLSTSTASGKSLVFMSVAAHLLISDCKARVLALYPARALIQDQLTKWSEFLSRFFLKVNYIDGDVPASERLHILRQCHVVLMTPDVAHAWLLANAGEEWPKKFLKRLKLLILDEAHVYDGVFGTNMAYFLRRLQAISGLERVISSTATLGEPERFIKQLTGRNARVLADEQDGSASPVKTFILAKVSDGKPFDAYLRLISSLITKGKITCPFLAFADSRRMVEQLVAVIGRSALPDDDLENNADPDETQEVGDEEIDLLPHKIYPYRAGYEDDDRKRIQQALGRGELNGVVSTSALELGIDIGELRTVLLLGVQLSAKALRQRIGRVGRKNHGVCVLIDDVGLVKQKGGLKKFVSSQPEPSWLYLDNRYIQFSQALCAAEELLAVGVTEDRLQVFDSLPWEFGQWLRNELNPKEPVPKDLYLLKQRAQSRPHVEFPLRSGVEKSFSVILVRGPVRIKLGSLTFSQSLREAYPGAVYYYMARPYRVWNYIFSGSEIRVKPEKRCTTDPILQTKVFPKFRDGLLSLRLSDSGFLAEAEVQVSERVIGFIEKIGSHKNRYEYGPNSPFSQKPLNRFFETTGVCWFFRTPKVLSEQATEVAEKVLKAFCVLWNIHERDIGYGEFRVRESPLGVEEIKGVCIYDAADGSLRLTQRLADNFLETVIAAQQLVAPATEPTEQEKGRELIIESLKQLQDQVAQLTLKEVPQKTTAKEIQDNDKEWATIIAPGERVYYQAPNGSYEEVEVKEVRYTPYGLMYELISDNMTRMVKYSDLIPLSGSTKFVRMNLVTGKLQSI